MWFQSWASKLLKFLRYLPNSFSLCKWYMNSSCVLTLICSWCTLILPTLFLSMLPTPLSFHHLKVLTWKQTWYLLSCVGFLLCNSVWWVSQTTKGNREKKEWVSDKEGGTGAMDREDGRLVFSSYLTNSPALPLLSVYSVGEKHRIFYIIIRPW